MQRMVQLVIVTVVCFLCCSPSVRADGGAPDLAYVAGSAQGISVIDVGQAKVIRTISLAGDPSMVQLSLDGRFLYAAQPALGRVSVLAAKTGRTYCQAALPGSPNVLILDPSGKTFYVADDTRVTALDTLTCAIRHIYQTQGPVSGLALATPGAGLASGHTPQLWASGSDAITVFDAYTSQQLASISVAGGPQYLTTPPGQLVYATTRRGSVDAVDFTTRRTRQLFSGGAFGPMDYDALTGEVYVPDRLHALLAVIAPLDTISAPLPVEPDRVLHTDAPPESIAITNNGLLGFAALQGGSVQMLDLLNRHMVYTVRVGGSPHFVITGLYPPADVPTPPQAAQGLQSMDWLLPGCGALIVLLVVLSFFIARRSYVRR